MEKRCYVFNINICFCELIANFDPGDTILREYRIYTTFKNAFKVTQ